MEDLKCDEPDWHSKPKRKVSETWNYRLCTWTERDEFEGIIRYFEIRKVFYINKRPRSYMGKDFGFTGESVEELKEDQKLRDSAFTRHILDLDNFPENYKEK